MSAETMLAFKFLLLLLSLFLAFFFRLFILQLHFWLCFLSWLLLSIFVYMYYMPFMCLFLECLFGFIFMISCIFKRLKVDFISVCLLASLSLSCFSSLSGLWISKWCDRQFAYSNVFGWFWCLSCLKRELKVARREMKPFKTGKL